jgi:hypothetical protein
MLKPTIVTDLSEAPPIPKPRKPPIPREERMSWGALDDLLPGQALDVPAEVSTHRIGAAMAYRAARSEAKFTRRGHRVWRVE